jgi:predicted AlkP superfamily phosphohydrolase/phosphomutase
MRPRVLVITLAEATFDLIQPMMNAGKLPTFARLMAGGAWGRLQSQVPFVTPQMCGTVVTGRSPGEHGLMDFYQRGDDGKYRETLGSDLLAPPIWRLLGERGFRCGIINAPFSYPPEKINGFMIAGEDAPGAHRSIAYPNSLYDELIAKFGRYPLKDTFPGGRDKKDYLSIITADVQRQGEIYEHVLRTRDWDFSLLFFSQTAMVQHYFWADHESRDPGNRFRNVVESAYVALDAAIDRLTKAAGEDATVFVISDCGAGPIQSGVNINQFLQELGLLQPKKAMREQPDDAAPAKPSLVERMRKTVQYYVQKDGFRWLYFALNHYLRPLKVWVQGRVSSQNIDWSGTKAYSRGQWGYVYVNLKGRDPHGIVNPGPEYEAVRDQIIEAFGKLIDPDTGLTAATKVWKREELYHGPGVEFAPDLVIDWRDGAYMPNESSLSKSVFGLRQREYMNWPTTGSHRLHGVLIAAGPGIAAGTTVQGARIIDLVPTWLRIFGQTGPKELEGKVINTLVPAPRMTSGSAA